MNSTHMAGRILGITLARAGSKGVPGKHVRKLHGKPLLAHTVTQALEVGELTDYVVSTDSPEIAEIAKEFGAMTPFLRPADLATDNATSVAALTHATQEMEALRDFEYDYVVEIMATNPLKTSDDIRACLQMLVSSQADSVIAVHRLEDHHPARIKKIVNGRIVDFCSEEIPESRRQDLTPHAYVRSGSIYALSRRYLMEEGRRYGSEHSLAYVLPPERVVNIDSELDWIVAEAMISNRETQERKD